MSFLTKAQCTVFLGIACFQNLSAVENPRDFKHRTPLAFPVSSPFTVPEAAKLPEWSQIRWMTERLRTDSGALALLHEMPQMEEKYGNASYFLDLVKKWRDRVPVLPENPGSTDQSDQSDSTWVVLENGQSRTISITFHHEIPKNSITIMRITWVGEQVTNLSFAGGFENVLSRENHSWSGNLRHSDGHVR